MKNAKSIYTQPVFYSKISQNFKYHLFEYTCRQFEFVCSKSFQLPFLQHENIRMIIPQIQLEFHATASKILENANNVKRVSTILNDSIFFQALYLRQHNFNAYFFDVMKQSTAFSLIKTFKSSGRKKLILKTNALLNNNHLTIY